jgi:hypothetical protein
MTEFAVVIHVFEFLAAVPVTSAFSAIVINASAAVPYHGMRPIPPVASAVLVIMAAKAVALEAVAVAREAVDGAEGTAPECPVDVGRIQKTCG